MKKAIYILISLIFFLYMPASGEELSEPWWRISESISGDFFVAIRENGSVTAVGDNKYGQCNVDDWKNVKKVATGEKHVVGLKKDGTVVATGDNSCGQCNTEDWKNIIDVAANENYTVALRDDGTIVYSGTEKKEIDNWNNIKSIFATGEIHGITYSGDVVSTLFKNEKFSNLNPRQVMSIDEYIYILTWEGNVFCKSKEDGSSFWLSQSEVVQMVDDGIFESLKSDGTVESSFFYQESWTDIIAITPSFGLKKDGTFIGAEDSKLKDKVERIWLNELK